MVNCDHKTCSPDQFTCLSGRCIEKEMVCNGWANCAQNEDETNCTHVHIPNMPGDHPSDSVGMNSLDDSDENRGSGSGTTVAIVFGVITIIVLAAIIIALVLHKRNIQPKVLVRPYVQNWYNNISKTTRMYAFYY